MNNTEISSDEILLIDKPDGMTSFGVVARVRRILSKKAGKKVKVGHTGTLDPFATGLLILMIGKGTKRCAEFLKHDKKYEATICLGKTSTTGDPEGEIESRVSDCSSLFEARSSLLSLQGSAANPRQQAPDPQKENYMSELDYITSVVKSFEGKIMQRVPNFSAVKINGQRAYDLARKGVEVEMPVREVEIYSVEVVDYKWPELKIACHVSSGTYIRTLGEDIGEKLGVGGYLTALRRTAISNFTVNQAEKLDEWMAENDPETGVEE